MRTWTVMGALAGVMVFALGCQSEPAQETGVALNVAAIQQVTELQQTTALSEGESVSLVPTVLRARRRMNIDQLDSAIRRVSNGIGWEVNGVDQFKTLALTLGKPDYLDVTQEDLSVSTLFIKFLDDAARHVCDALMIQEQQALPEDRVFFVHAAAGDTLKSNPDGVMKNLRMLLLLYHGKKVVENGPELEPWKWYMESASHVSGDAESIWQGVCVGLMTHPHFYTY